MTRGVMAGAELHVELDESLIGPAGGVSKVHGDGEPGSVRGRLGTGYLAVFFATALWASSGIFINRITERTAVSAPALAFWRDLATFILLVVGLGLFRPGSLRVRRRDLRWLAPLGVSLGTFHVLWNLSVILNGVAVSTVQQVVSPVLVTIVARFALREPLTRRKILAIVLAFIGTVLVSGVDALAGTSLSVVGLLAGIGLALFYGAFSLFGKQIAGNYSPLTVLAYGTGFAALALFPFQFLVPQPWPLPSIGLLYFAAWLVLATIIPFSAYIWGLARLQASVASILAMMEIPIAYLYAYVLLGERLAVVQIVGALLTAVGVVLLSWGGWREASERALGGGESIQTSSYDLAGRSLDR